ERRNALLVPLNQYLQRGLDIRRDPVPELFGQRQLSLAHAAAHIPVPVFPQVRPMNAYPGSTGRSARPTPGSALREKREAGGQESRVQVPALLHTEKTEQATALPCSFPP